MWLHGPWNGALGSFRQLRQRLSLSADKAGAASPSAAISISIPVSTAWVPVTVRRSGVAVGATFWIALAWTTGLAALSLLAPTPPTRSLFACSTLRRLFASGVAAAAAAGAEDSPLPAEGVAEVAAAEGALPTAGRRCTLPLGLLDLSFLMACRRNVGTAPQTDRTHR